MQFPLLSQTDILQCIVRKCWPETWK